MKKQNRLALLAAMLTFFTMGFVDLVGIASNYVQKDFSLTDTTAGIFPSLVFVWFFVFGVPTGMLMNRIGRRKTVLVSLALTVVALVLPLLNYSFLTMAVAFCLLGIGNAIMQTSLNPLVDSVMKGGASASTLTFGQFVKSIASFLAPIIASWGATTDAFGLGWRVLYPIYLGVPDDAAAVWDEDPLRLPREGGEIRCRPIRGVFHFAEGPLHPALLRCHHLSCRH